MYICNAITPTVLVNKAFANNNVQDPRPTAWIKILKIDKGVNYMYFDHIFIIKCPCFNVYIFKCLHTQ